MLRTTYPLKQHHTVEDLNWIFIPGLFLLGRHTSIFIMSW